MIFPTPKFISGVTEVVITNSYTDPTFNAPEIIEQRSPITGKRNYVLKGDRAIFLVTVLLEKYADPQTTFETLDGFKGATVDEFYVDQNGEAVYNASGGKEKFIIESVIPVYLVDYKRYSIAIMKFVSQKYVKAPEFKYDYLKFGDGSYIQFGDGGKIII